MQESVVEYLRGKQLYLSRYDHCGSLGYSAIYRIALNFYRVLIYVTVWLAVVFGINSASNAGGKTVIVQGKAEHYYSFPACIMRNINSKYYG